MVAAATPLSSSDSNALARANKRTAIWNEQKNFLQLPLYQFKYHDAIFPHYAHWSWKRKYRLNDNERRKIKCVIWDVGKKKRREIGINHDSAEFYSCKIFIHSDWICERLLCFWSLIMIKVATFLCYWVPQVVANGIYELHLRTHTGVWIRGEGEKKRKRMHLTSFGWDLQIMISFLVKLFSTTFSTSSFNDRLRGRRRERDTGTYSQWNIHITLSFS